MEFHACDYSVVQDIYEHWISKDILTYIRIALGKREKNRLSADY